MKTYYSVIFASINSIISERLSIGLILMGEERVWFRYSSKKLSLMKQFFSDESYQLIKSSLKNIESTVNNVSMIQPVEENILLEASAKYSSVLTPDYLRYLSRYSNATLTFNEPVEIDAQAGDKLFNHLYSEFVYVDQIEQHKTSRIEAVRSKLYPSIKKNVNLNQRIETGEIPGLIMPVELDFIGKNERPVVGKVTDFNQQNNYLDHSLSSLFVLMKTFEMNNQTGNYFIIGNEPDKQLLKQHRTWQEVRSSNFLNFVPFDETQRISEYMQEHRVMPFFPIEA